MTSPHLTLSDLATMQREISKPDPMTPASAADPATESGARSAAWGLQDHSSYDSSMEPTAFTAEPKPEPKLEPKPQKRIYTRRRPQDQPHGLLKQSRNDYIIETLRAGTHTMADLARHLNVSRERIRQIAKKYYGETARSLDILRKSHPDVVARELARAQAIIERRQAREHTRNLKLARIKELHEAGLTQKEIAEAMAIQQNTVSKYLIEMGCRSVVKKRSPPGATVNTSPAWRPHPYPRHRRRILVYPPRPRP